MGGIVARRFMRLHPATWRAADDAEGRGRGGRLVMLGTPNRGSFAIPLTLTGVEKLVQTLARFDIKHDLRGVLAVLGSFPGIYQMLPSDSVDLDDDHSQLFDAQTWGQLPIRAPLLARGRAFLRDLHEVVDPHRMAYVAGCNQPTPGQVRVDAPGKFSYRETLDGDGRVTHQLGVLEEVPVYWVDEVHGDLAKNGKVLDGIGDLLRTGATGALPTAKPRAPERRRARRGWVASDELAALPPAIDEIVLSAKRRGGGAIPELTRREAVQLENLVLAEYLGSGEAAEPAPVVGDGADPPAGKRQKVAIEVAWGDIRRVDADVYSVGHYLGVVPQNAELALDEAVSGVDREADYDRRRLVITQHTRRGLVHGGLGDVSFFPWGDRRHAGRIVAVAGMGRPGTFDPPALRRLVGGLVLAVGTLPTARTVCMVLIGSGEGTLTIPEAVRGLIAGIRDAAGEIAARDDLVFTSPVERLIVAERDWERAHEIRDALREALALHNGKGREPTGPVELEVNPRIREVAGRAVSVEDSLALLVGAALRASASDDESGDGKLEALAGGMHVKQSVRAMALERLRAEALREPPNRRLPRFRVQRREVGSKSVEFPVRVSFWEDGEAIRAAAINRSATVPERLIAVGHDIVDDLAEKLRDPPPEQVGQLGRLLSRLLVPSEFRGALTSGSIVFEIDRAMACVHWEMLASASDADGDARPLAVERCVARQLRTTYSSPPLPPRQAAGVFRALVIGDPGDPEKGEDLPGARTEALRVKGDPGDP